MIADHVRARAAEHGIQPTLAPRNTCYGCGPSNASGLQLVSYPLAAPSREIVAQWQPAQQHQAFPGVLNGGVIGTLLDCHSNWAAIWHFLHEDGGEVPRCCVTGEFSVRLRRPTPLGPPVQVRAWVEEQPADDRVLVSAELHCEGNVCATCRGVFFSVGEDHPAHHAW
ncbi:MAG: PaaI family thioesterase [Pseudomonadota bacterium]